MSPFAGTEVYCRSWFLNTFLSADQDWIKEREYLESIKCLDCAAQKAQQRSSLAFVLTIIVSQSVKRFR
jgi:hypothetical protein